MQQKIIDQQIAHLKSLLKIEKEEDFERFRLEIKELSQSEKKKKGLCWYPLQVTKEGYSFGERAFIIVEKTQEFKNVHQFRAGSPVSVYSLATDKYSNSATREAKGVVYYVDKMKMKIILNGKDLPDWRHHGDLGVDLLFDERTYIEMEKALDLVLNAKNNRLSELKAMFYGKMEPTFKPLPTVDHPYLNDSQKEAIKMILAADDITLVHGPPGTGKTTTLVNAIQILCKTERHVLVTAPSNNAVDLLSERLSEKGLNVVRIGNISRVQESLLNLTLDVRLSRHPESKNIKKVKIKAAQMRREARQYKRKFGGKEREERKAAYQEARELEDWAKRLEDRLLSEMLFNADVITCTLVNAVHPVLDQLKFRTIFIDEAAQALEPAAWIPITRAHRVVLAGDPFQLPPTVKSTKAAARGLNVSLLESAVYRFEKVSFLDEQYRMNKTIMGFSNTQFYEQKLKAAQHVSGWQLEIDLPAPVIFIDTAGCGFAETIHPETESKLNKDEFYIFREHFLQLVKSIADDMFEMPTVGVISPYRAQTKLMKEEFSTDESTLPYLEFVDINTIDAFQGQERDVIYISLVRNNEKGEIGFLKDYRRMNVAMTRAKKQLIVIGDSATIGNDSFYQSFIDYVEKVGGYQSAWEYMG